MTAADAQGRRGETGSAHRPGARKDVHALVWHPTVLGRAFEPGGDGGLTWRAAEGRDRRYAWVLAVDPMIPVIPLVGTFGRPRASDSPTCALTLIVHP